MFVGKKTKLEILRANTKQINWRICMKKELPSKEHGKKSQFDKFVRSVIERIPRRKLVCSSKRVENYLLQKKSF